MYQIIIWLTSRKWIVKFSYFLIIAYVVFSELQIHLLGKTFDFLTFTDMHIFITLKFKFHIPFYMSR